MFANILTTAMDEVTSVNAHPSFVEIIKQLTPVEARILKFMIGTEEVPMIDIQKINLKIESYVYIARNVTILNKFVNCDYPVSFPVSIDNLLRIIRKKEVIESTLNIGI